ncbi:MAG TPA: carboxypeptidase-like regulatory domain-containing protein [Blastocatellia bacterium]|nr:carboxypeptidase-like regulatory domain-containing protein [Blastocatellia bacterium]
MFFLVISAGFAFGQNTSISGAITDPQGNAVAGATVTVTNKVTKAARTVVTTSDGSYQIPQLAPGQYQVRAEAQGFKAIVKDDVELLVSTPLTLNLAFTEVGAVSETVTVTGGETTLNTTDATIGNTFNEVQVKELPLLSRNVVGLLTLQPGVTADGYVNGGRSDQANVTLDGIDVNDQQNGLDPVSGAALFSVLRSTPDSLQEFRVTTTNPNADQGRSSGAQIALVTKSGTNQFHGSLYEYHRNTVTAANDWFNNKDGVERPQLLRNNFGGSIGGPIRRDRIFFFFNYEGFREAKGSTVVREVPLATLGQGVVRYVVADGSDPASTPCPAPDDPNRRCRSLTSAQINAAYTAANGVTPGINPAALAVLADAARRYPANSTTEGDGLNTGGFRFNASTPVRQNTFIARFDANLTSKQNIFARLNYQSDVITGVSRFPDTPAPETWHHPKGFAVGHAWTLSNSIVNNFRYGLTRDSLTVGGDSQANQISFRFIYQPLNFSRTLNRTTPLHNFVDDLSWNKGTHSMQFGTNIRLITNSRTSFGKSFDIAITNPSYYDFSGDVVLTSDAGDPVFPNVGGAPDDLRDALTAIIGRYSQYSANLNYDKSGSLLSVGQGVARDFATQEYEFYGQDSWRIRPNLTVTYGLRWSTSTPVYETNGIQVKPTQSLGKFFEQRVAGAEAGKPFNDLITVDLAGKANDRGGYYEQDWNNFAPSLSVAWSPNFKNSFLKRVFGENKSTIRGGFRMTYDRIGSQLAVAFDLNSTLGFSSSKNISANTFNVSDRLGPLFTGFNQSVRTLPGLTIPATLKFPLQTPADEDQRIESSLDDTLVTPVNYSFNLSWGRDLGKGFSVEASYVGRLARDLLVARDIMHLNNLRDPKSGDTWYSAMRKLIPFREQNAAITSVQKIPYFENIFPGLAGNYSVNGQTVALTATQAAYRRIAQRSVGGRNTTDYTFVQLLWDDGFGYGDNLFFHPQYAAFSTFSTIGTSDYHSAQLSIRKRFNRDFSFDFNYTLSHSIDIASGLQSSGSYGSAFILNPLDLNSNRANSDFDIRHLINANYIVALPFGDGKRFFNKLPKVVNAIIGGWETTGIFRWNTGLPSGQPFDDARWATNWNVQSNGVAIRPVESSPTRTGEPNIFSDPKAAFQSYRNAYPGEAGDRNILREPGYVVFDLGLYKAFKLPGEGKQIKFRWEVFNLTNTQHFTGIANFGIPQEPYLGKTPPPDWGKFTAIQGSPRVMQFALRIEF